MDDRGDFDRSGRLTVDLDALRANFRAVQAVAGVSRSAAVVKADGYGLGASIIARALGGEGCRDFFVAHLAEAIDLLPGLPQGSRLYVLNGLVAGTEGRCADAGAIPVLNSVRQVHAWRDHARAIGRPLAAALQVDSGMGRLGMSIDEAATIAAEPGIADHVRIELLMTHLACAEQPENSTNRAQLERFESVAGLFPDARRSIANSAGAFLGDGFRQDLVRVGIGLFGVDLSPLAGTFEPVVDLRVRVIQTHWIGAGDGVGYGLDYIATESRRIATLGVGYADGWPRSLSGRGAAWLGARRLPIVGRVSMDLTTIDVTDVAEDELGEGDFVELIGPSQSLDDVARDAGTIAYEILTQMGRRYERVYRDSRAAKAEGNIA